jgi:hypothetical protein
MTALDLLPAHVENLAAILRDALAAWHARDDSEPDQEARQAGTWALAAMDAARQELYAARQQLAKEIRASDAAARGLRHPNDGW